MQHVVAERCDWQLRKTNCSGPMRLPHRGSTCIDDQTTRLAGLQTPFPAFIYYRMDLHQMASLMNIPIWAWTLVPNSQLSAFRLSFLGICFRREDTKLDTPLFRSSRPHGGNVQTLVRAAAQSTPNDTTASTTQEHSLIHGALTISVCDRCMPLPQCPYCALRSSDQGRT